MAFTMDLPEDLENWLEEKAKTYRWSKKGLIIHYLKQVKSDEEKENENGSKQSIGEG